MTDFTKIADDLERLCCAETEGKFFDYVTDSIGDIVKGLRSAAQGAGDCGDQEPVRIYDADDTPPEPVQGGKGEAVAWLYEVHVADGRWSQRYTDAKPEANAWQRNIRPLYLAAPQPTSNAYASPIPRAASADAKAGWRLDFEWLDKLRDQIEETTGYQVTIECVQEAVLRTEALLLSSTHGEGCK